jgi:hypothetical protein
MLIDDTIGFEQKHILDLFSTGAIDIVAAYRWFRAAKSLPDHPQALESSLQGDMWVFFKGFASLLMPSKVGTKIPDTFMFDKDRISNLRSDVLDFVNLEICVREWCKEGQSSPIPTESSLSAEECLRRSILAIIENTSREGRWSQNYSSIAIEILRPLILKKNTSIFI